MRTFFCSPFVSRSNDQYSSTPQEGEAAIGIGVSPEVSIYKQEEMGPVPMKLRSNATPSPRCAITESEQTNGKFRDVSNSFPLLSSQWTKIDCSFFTPTYTFHNEPSTHLVRPARPTRLPPNAKPQTITSDIANAWLSMESSSSSSSFPSVVADTSSPSSQEITPPNKPQHPPLCGKEDHDPHCPRPRPEMIRYRHESTNQVSASGVTSVESLGTLLSSISATTGPRAPYLIQSGQETFTTNVTKTAPARDPTELKDCVHEIVVVAKSSGKRSKTAHKKQRGIMSTSGGGPSNPATKWRSAVDPKSGRTYYYHLETRETQWRKPMDLASKEERAIMEEKERRQRDFFAQMESNILKSMSQGVVPGGNSPKPSRSKPLSSSSTNTSTAPTPNPRSPATNLRTALKQVSRPAMVRTISSMDEDVLKDLVKRVPSTRDLTGKKSRSKAKKQESIPLDGLDEANSREFEINVDDLLNSLPTDGLTTVIEDDMNNSSMFNESTSSFTSNGFLSWEETRALQKLAQVTHEMAIMPDENSPMRDLTEETYEDDDDDEVYEEEEGDAPLEIQWNGAPQEFEVLSETPTPQEVSPPTVLQPPKPEGKESPNAKPELKRRNTCGTLYVGTTMSAPDKDATIKVVCGVFRAHIMQSEAEEIKAPLGPEVEPYRIFNDLESQQQARRGSIGFQRRRSLEHKNSLSERPEPPALEDICFFYRDIFRRSQMESDCIIMSLIYVERLIKSTDGALRPRTSNWRSLLFSCMILASKVWDDLSMWNADFSQACPPGVQFTLKRINELEVAVLSALKFIVKVPASEYAKYYFVLRSMLIKSGLGGGDMLSNTPLDVEGARRLQQVTAHFQATSATKARVAQEKSLRSKSMGDAEKRKLMAGALRAIDKNKVSLEHMVQM